MGLEHDLLDLYETIVNERMNSASKNIKIPSLNQNQSSAETRILDDYQHLSAPQRVETKVQAFSDILYDAIIEYDITALRTIVSKINNPIFEGLHSYLKPIQSTDSIQKEHFKRNYIKHIASTSPRSSNFINAISLLKIINQHHINPKSISTMHLKNPHLLFEKGQNTHEFRIDEGLSSQILKLFDDELVAVISQMPNYIKSSTGRNKYGQDSRIPKFKIPSEYPAKWKSNAFGDKSKLEKIITPNQALIYETLFEVLDLINKHYEKHDSIPFSNREAIYNIGPDTYDALKQRLIEHGQRTVIKNFKETNTVFPGKILYGLGYKVSKSQVDKNDAITFEWYEGKAGSPTKRTRVIDIELHPVIDMLPFAGYVLNKIYNSVKPK